MTLTTITNNNVAAPTMDDNDDDRKPAAKETTSETDHLSKDPTDNDMPPTYQNSKSSVYYTTAMTMLQKSEFEQAMEVIMNGIENVYARLGDQDIDRHEALAPFQYLYGTTLLYNIEESDEQQVEAQAPTENGEGEEEEPGDLQIAFENLEVARVTIEEMMHSMPSEDLKSDLAQVYLKVGNLNCLNGRYGLAIDDYLKCLGYLQDCSLISNFGRRVAEVHLLISGSCQSKINDIRDKSDAESNPGSTTDETDCIKYQQLSFYHSCLAVRTLSGEIATVCGQDADKFVADVETKESLTIPAKDDISLEPALKYISSLRQRVVGLTVPDTCKAEVDTLVDTIDEIKETVECSESAKKGVSEVTAMRLEKSAAIEDQSNINPFTGEAKTPQADVSTTTNNDESTRECKAKVNDLSTTLLVRKKVKRSNESTELKEPPTKRPREDE